MKNANANPGDAARRVLIIKLSALGDFVLALGAMKYVRNAHPSAHITLLTTPPFEAFAKACPYFDGVETDGRPADTRGTAALIKRLRSSNYDVVYDFQTSGRTGNYFQALRPKPPLWSGIATGCAFPDTNPARATTHTIERLAGQLEDAGIGPEGGFSAATTPMPDVSWIHETFGSPPRLQPAYFSLYGPYALLIPGSSEHRSAKRWPQERYIELAGHLVAEGVTPVVIGGKSESAIGLAVTQAHPDAKTLCTRTDLFQVATLAMQASFVVGNDTGPMHMSTLAGAPGVALFATTESDPGHSRPRGSNVIVLQAPTLEDVPVSAVMQAIRAIGGFTDA